MLIMVIYWRKRTCYNEKHRTFNSASKEMVLEINADKTKYYMFMARNQNARRYRNIKINSSSFERMEEFAFLATNLTNQNLFRKILRAK
jgi:hypothetical protein